MKLKNLKPFFIGILCLILASSCVSRKEIAYFQDLPEITAERDMSQTNLRIQPNDLLTITVAAANIEAVQPFNLPVTTAPRFGETGVTGNVQLQSYLVDSDGNIEFPVLGKINVSGKTRQELVEILRTHISDYVQNPIINVRIINFQVTILGEVNRPGTYSVPDERISLPKALGLAGDLTIYGQRDNVMIIRDVGGTTVSGYVDLTEKETINSPFYFLQQNDVVIVEPNNAQRQSSGYNRNSTVYISIASVLLSLILIIIR